MNHEEQSSEVMEAREWWQTFGVMWEPEDGGVRRELGR